VKRLSAAAFSLVLAFISNSFLSQPAKAHEHSTDPMAIHGMLMVGTSSIYISHLPMFHSPHNYQAIFEIVIDDASRDKYIEAKQNSMETVYTLVPEAFVLPEMISHPQVFKAKIFKGHFERGGQMIASNVNVKISKVIYAKKFEPLDIKPTGSTNIIFGNKSEQFMAHAVTTAPDFDQVMAIGISKEAIALLDTQPYLMISFSDFSNAMPLQAPIDLKSEYEVKATSTLYLEFDDLSN
jgi:hypothetical protein